MQLKGKVALVTGGSRGIGAAIVRRLAGAGAAVALTYARASEQAQALVDGVAADGGQAVAIAADSSDAAAVAAAVERTVSAFGRLDIVVSNAGIFPYASLDDTSVATFDLAMAVHVRAAFVAAQAASPHLREGGRLLHIGSCLGQRVGGPGMTAYAASKSALIGLSKGLAHDLGARGITVNLIQPGPIDTDMNPADGEGADQQRQALPLNRFGDADDVAAMVLHLAGDGGRYVTGAVIDVDGGFSA